MTKSKYSLEERIMYYELKVKELEFKLWKAKNRLGELYEDEAIKAGKYSKGSGAETAPPKGAEDKREGK